MSSSITPWLLHRSPLRKVNTRGSRNITGFVCSSKMPGTTIPHESQNELAFLKRAEIDPLVEEIHAQPMLARYRDADGRNRDAFPDFAVRIGGVVELHEVKPDEQFEREEVRDRLVRVAIAAERRGIRYLVSLASDLHRKSDAAAIAAAWRRLKSPVGPLIKAAVDDMLQDGPAAIEDLLAATRQHSSTIATFHALLAQGHVRADMTTEPDETMVLHHRSSGTTFPSLIPSFDPRQARP